MESCWETRGHNALEAWRKAAGEAKMEHLVQSPQAPGWGEWEEGME